MRIAFLADHPEHVGTLARWHYDEWRDLIPDWSCQLAESELRSHIGRAAIPTTLIALNGDELIGSASLLVEDLPEYRQFTPWVASVYVAWEWRGQQVGSRLVNRAVEIAGECGAPAAYLLTPGQAAFYRKLGWHEVALPPDPGRKVTIMSKPTR